MGENLTFIPSFFVYVIFSYEFKVTPKNELGSGPSSDPVSFSTESGKFYKPQNPLKSYERKFLINSGMFALRVKTLCVSNYQVVLSVALNHNR